MTLRPYKDTTCGQVTTTSSCTSIQLKTHDHLRGPSAEVWKHGDEPSLILRLGFTPQYCKAEWTNLIMAVK